MTLANVVGARACNLYLAKRENTSCLADLFGYSAKQMSQTTLDTLSTPATRAAVIKALAHPSRVLLAESLMQGARCVCELQEIVGADMSTVSKHLSLMREAGVIQSERRGLNIYYSLACPCLADFFRCVDLIAAGKAPADACAEDACCA